jgi:large subunit ribosomal protein L32
MALPKKKISKSRRDLRRANDRLKPTGYHECANCGEMKLPHHVCRACGYYDGREVVRAGSAESQ